MSDPYVGEIRIFGGNFEPAGWMFCRGQLLAISEFSTLFQLIGTTYGGDGQSNFGLPDLRGRVPIHTGTGAGLASRIIGQSGGQETATVSNAQLPAHSHTLLVSEEVGKQAAPQGNLLAQLPAATSKLYHTPTSPVSTSPNSIAETGGSQPHDNLQPYLCLNYIISLFGVFPSQS
jgi:microcystin-dependent protein